MGDVSKIHNEVPGGTVKTRVTMNMKVIRAADGSIEDFGEQSARVVEMDYMTAVSLLGQEHADELFAGAKGANDGTD
jgi:hypothetical protein